MKHAKILLGVSVALNLVLLFNYVMLRQTSLTRIVSEYKQSSSDDPKSTHPEALTPDTNDAVNEKLLFPGKLKNNLRLDSVSEMMAESKHNVVDKKNMDSEDNTQRDNVVYNEAKLTKKVENQQRVRHVVKPNQQPVGRVHAQKATGDESRRKATKIILKPHRSSFSNLDRPPAVNQDTENHKPYIHTARKGNINSPDSPVNQGMDDVVQNLQAQYQPDLSDNQRHIENKIQKNPKPVSNELPDLTDQNQRRRPQQTDPMKVYNWNGKVWVANQTVCRNVHGFVKASLHTNSGATPIYVYDPKKDKWISESVIRTGSWEPEVSVAVSNALNTDPNLSLIDIGANIGVVSLYAAKMGRHVISIEPLRANVQRLCASYRDGGFTDRVAIVLNAISDKHETVSLGRDLNNIGGTFVIKENPNKAHATDVSFDGAYKENIPTILLDDLLTLFSPDALSKVVIKMDVEGYEDHVLRGAKKFFKQVHVRALIMEWTYSKQQSTAGFIQQFLINQGMIPYDISMTRVLSGTPYQTWPINVMWLNSDYQNQLHVL